MSGHQCFSSQPGKAADRQPISWSRLHVRTVLGPSGDWSGHDLHCPRRTSQRCRSRLDSSSRCTTATVLNLLQALVVSPSKLPASPQPPSSQPRPAWTTRLLPARPARSTSSAPRPGAAPRHCTSCRPCPPRHRPGGSQRCWFWDQADCRLIPCQVSSSGQAGETIRKGGSYR